MPYTPLHLSRHIRELRMGAPKSWKTGSVVETYPTPILVLEFDQSGLSVVVDRAVTQIKTTELKLMLAKRPDELPVVSELPYYLITKPQITDDWKPQPNQETFKHVMWNINCLVSQPTVPYKTVVLDGMSRLQEFMLQYMPQTPGGSEQLVDARKWAFSVGAKAMQILSTLYSLPCHVVALCHIDSAERNLVTGTVDVLPLIYGKQPKREIGGLPSAFFYQRKVMGKPRLVTSDLIAATDNIRGLGATWPKYLPAELDPTFQAIYETEYKAK